MSEFVNRVLDVIENDVVPITRRNVSQGCKLFGAAILLKSDLSLVVAESNYEIVNPMWHGEVHCLKKFFEMSADKRPSAKDCLFVSTHEPCSLCLNGITWSGFDNIYYLYSHKDSMNEFGVPYDIQILEAIHAVPDPDRAEPAKGRDLYNRKNHFFESYSIKDIALATKDATIVDRLAKLKQIYDEISEQYQRSKGQHGDLFLP